MIYKFEYYVIDKLLHAFILELVFGRHLDY